MAVTSPSMPIPVSSPPQRRSTVKHWAPRATLRCAQRQPTVRPPIPCSPSASTIWMNSTSEPSPIPTRPPTRSLRIQPMERLSISRAWPVTPMRRPMRSPIRWMIMPAGGLPSMPIRVSSRSPIVACWIMKPPLRTTSSSERPPPISLSPFRASRST